ncbi:MAG: radical SAM protein [Planctomycetes bacterium]|nr:radical SAM protein [Planctomycetota bacterium]
MVFDGRELVIVWRIWESCSLACRFCGYSRELSRPRLAAEVPSIIAFAQVLRDVQQEHGRSILVSWLGGEPLAWAELPGLSRILAREHGLRLGVTTNGLPLESPRVRASLLSDYQQVTVSIDGLAPFHDHVRRMPGLFDRIGEATARLCSEDSSGRLWRRVNTVLMRGNIEKFAQFCEAVADWGFHELTFNQLGGNERPEFYPANRLLPEQIMRFTDELPGIRRRMADRGLLIRGTQRYLARITATSNGEQIAVEDCNPACRFLFIDTLGRISPCSFTSDSYGIPISEIDSAEAFLTLPDRFRAMQRERRLAACDDCHATHVFDKFKSQTGVAPSVRA